MGRCKRYVRNFVTEEPSGPQDFDVITEFWFDVEGSYAEASQQLSDAATRIDARSMKRASSASSSSRVGRR
jgi:hypothetical protein